MLAHGLDGGGAGDASRIVVWPGTEQEQVLQERTSFFGPLAADDVVSVRSGGGGGWGDPLGRDREQVARDVRDELLTGEEARETYGVALAGTGGDVRVDVGETDRLRSGAGARSTAGTQEDQGQ